MLFGANSERDPRYIIHYDLPKSFEGAPRLLLTRGVITPYQAIIRKLVSSSILLRMSYVNV